MSARLDGRVALVTGASRGIGAAIARRLAGHGAQVAVHHRRGAEDARAVLATLEGEGHFLVAGDLGDPESARGVVEATVDHYGRLDVLVNNAGVFVQHPPLSTDWDAWVATWNDTLGANLLGPAHTSYWAARHLGEGGRIVNIGSRGAYRGEPNAPAYGAAKAGLHQLTQSLAVALAPRGISVLGIAPGFVETAMARPHLQGAAGDAVRAQSPFDRVATVDEVAYWVLCACMPDAAFASGAIIDVNGASYLRS
ncbi:MAG: SDR family oxidoreductase [Sandaracinaceae bacterium]|nr:SDR family oxidoreductase [Sandaracinaceae bacterium]